MNNLFFWKYRVSSSWEMDWGSRRGLAKPRFSWSGRPFSPILKNHPMELWRIKHKRVRKTQKRFYRNSCRCENVDGLTRPRGKIVWDKWQVKAHQAVDELAEREQCIVFEHRLRGYMELSLKPDSTFYLLCDLAQVIKSFWASVSSSLKLACYSTRFKRWLWGFNQIV